MAKQYHLQKQIIGPLRLLFDDPDDPSGECIPLACNLGTRQN